MGCVTPTRYYTDPVCGMKVPETTPYRLVHNGKVYYFCSEKCMIEFKKRPEYYLEHGPQGMPH